MRLSELKIIVTGAAQGMGRAMPMALAESGADVMLADINGAGAAKTAETIKSLGRRAIPVTCDVSAPEQIRAMFGQLDREESATDADRAVAREIQFHQSVVRGRVFLASNENRSHRSVSFDSVGCHRQAAGTTHRDARTGRFGLVTSAGLRESPLGTAGRCPA